MPGKCHPLFQSKNALAPFHQTGLLQWCQSVITDASLTEWNTKQALNSGDFGEQANYRYIILIFYSNNVSNLH